MEMSRCHFFYGKSFSCLFNTEANKKTASVPTANDAMCSTVSVVAALFCFVSEISIVSFSEIFSTPFYCLEQNKKKRKFHWAVWRLSSQRVLKAQLATRKRSENIDFMPLAGINLTPPTCTSRSVYRAYIYDFIRQSNSSF